MANYVYPVAGETRICVLKISNFWQNWFWPNKDKFFVLDLYSNFYAYVRPNF